MANILKSLNENLYKAFICMYGNILSTLLENSIIIWPLKHFFINIGKNIKRYSNFIKKLPVESNTEHAIISQGSNK